MVSIWGLCWKKENLQGKFFEVNYKERENYVSQEEVAEREGWKNKLDHLNLLEDKRRQQKLKWRWAKGSDVN